MASRVCNKGDTSGQGNGEVVGLSASQVEALFTLFTERGRQEKMISKSFHCQSLQWILNSGASRHGMSNIQALENVYNLFELISIAQPDGGVFLVKKAENMNLDPVSLGG